MTVYKVKIKWIQYEMLCAIWYHYYNLKNVKNNHGVVLLFLKLIPATLLKVKLLHGCFFHVFKIVQMVLNRAKHHLYELISCVNQNKEWKIRNEER